jgi:GTP pyrophosphokinase
VHVPLDVNNAVAETRLQLGGYGTGALVDFYLAIVVDVAKGIVTGDGMTTAGELILQDIVLGDVDGLLLVELLRHDEEILTEFLQKNQQEYTPAVADRLAEFHDIRKRNDFFIALGQKKVLLGEKDIDELTGKNKKDHEEGGWLKYVPFIGSKKKKDEPQKELFVVPDKFNRKKPIFITEENISQYKFPGCCHPIPGDDALGYIDNKNQIEIHKRNCPVAAKLKTSFGNRILDIKWDMHKTLYFDATIRLGGIDRVGLLNEVTQILSAQMNVNIHTVNITCEDGIFDGSIELRVHDRDDVKTIINNLKGVPDLKEISQIM